jgi:glycosyltransferase involved in cell wall biosynthesis
MRFGMVTTFYPPYSYGGDATYVRNLSCALVARGHEVEVIASSDAYFVRSNDESPADPTVEDGVKVHRLRHPAGLLAPLISQQTGRSGLYTPALNAFFSKPFDVLHFHNISLMGGPAVVRMGEARARVISLHDHWLICPTHVLWKNRSRACDRRTCFTCSIRSGLPPQLWRYTDLRERSLAKVDRLLSPSAFTAAIHRASGIRTPIEVLPLYSSVEPSRAPGNPASTRILYVGRVTELKGVRNLVRTVAVMPDVELLVIGDGDLKDSLVQAYGDRPNIRFQGKLDQQSLAAHYADAAAVVVPTIVPETFGLAVVEAAACGTPAIVAKGAGGAAEIVTTTGGGVTYDGDAELAAAIRRLTGDSKERSRMGALARAGYEKHYTREKHLAAYLGHVETIMHGRA